MALLRWGGPWSSQAPAHSAQPTASQRGPRTARLPGPLLLSSGPHPQARDSSTGNGHKTALRTQGLPWQGAQSPAKPQLTHTKELMGKNSTAHHSWARFLHSQVYCPSHPKMASGQNPMTR